ncbi:hypothetical protein KB1_25170 [Cutibacterium modestum]|uniref:Uncharacterized protein n=1 Tax=Cutibacterium modestum TaxID=2559073 RepID=A0AAD1NVZ9_9ACTN|nr:hypothetical protein KB1_25170 [Cutibacterium modestum]
MPCPIEVLGDSIRLGRCSRKGPHDNDGAILKFIHEGTTEVTQPAFDPVARYGITDGLGHDKTDPRRNAKVRSRSRR